MGNVLHLSGHQPVTPERLERAYLEQESRLIQYLALRLGSAAQAQDIAQATFVRLWKRVGDILDDNLVALIFVTARNLANDALRDRSAGYNAILDCAVDLSVADGVPDQADSAEQVLVTRQNIELVVRLLGELPPKCRAAFTAYVFDQLSYAEIAAQMAISESMVRKYVLRAHAHCSVRFDQLEGWE